MVNRPVGRPTKQSKVKCDFRFASAHAQRLTYRAWCVADLELDGVFTATRISTRCRNNNIERI